MTLHSTPRAAAEAAFFSHPGDSLQAFRAAMDAFEREAAGVNFNYQIVFEPSQVYANGTIRRTVLVKDGITDKGGYYLATDFEVGELKRGVTPEELDLTPVADRDA